MIEVASQQQMKQTNTIGVFRMIQSNEGTSRAIIAKRLKLSPTTISSIVEELISKKFVVERSMLASKGAGRKAISLEINDSAKYMIGIEVNFEHIKGTAYNLRSEPIVSVTSQYNEKKLTSDMMIDKLKQTIQELIQNSGDRFDELFGICIGVPALLDADKKIIVMSTVLNFENVDFYHSLQSEFDCPIFIENETVLAAAAEKQNHVHVSPFVYLSINEGLGASVIVKDEYLQGANGVFLEIGHMSLDMNGDPCMCDNYGCFELYVSITAMEKKVKKLLPQYPDSIINELITRSGWDRIEYVLVEAANRNDPLATKTVEEVAGNLGSGIANVINIFNPEMIVIGGRLSVLGDRLLSAVRARAEQRAIKPFMQRCSIELATLKDDVVSKGASIYALNKLLESHII